MASESSPKRDPVEPPQSRSPSPGPTESLTLRALVSTKEAGAIIGKAGKNVADLRDQTGVKAGVSKVIPGIHERVLTVTGSVEAVAKAYSLIIEQLVNSNLNNPPVSTPNVHTSIRLLISHDLTELKIKDIQDGSGARIAASEETLPQSTERIVEVQGSPESIGRAIEEIGQCLLEDWEKGLETVLYHPRPQHERHNRRGDGGSSYTGNSGAGRQTKNRTRSKRGSSNSGQPAPTTQNISIPSDMVGCIIGRSGTKITEIRRLSGSKISIAKAPHDDTGERMFTIFGTPEANEKALFLLYNQLESEKERRASREAQQEE
ncbi:hypothetical protein EST38_g1108 [Candolleomyces aberdarensis]|uniref:K Homology domain-containing protein n=1 Tax=Candolleomyces aberdarensis TaxID=2316362 RepID=A0A4Q2DXY8_9AGAR|nr:hypothetical protein EST38_g1108 [Candolleomyces aberdarensis]